MTLFLLACGSEALVVPDEKQQGDGLAARLEAHTRWLSQEMVPRDFSHPENLEVVSDQLFDHFDGIDSIRTVAFQDYEVEGNRYRNVVASLGPETKERLVVGAHYDAFGELPGADDNASGTAGLMELASLLRSDSLSVQVDLVAFTLEELPAFGSTDMGSAVHAQSLLEAGADLQGMISMEMIGYFTDDANTQEYPEGVPESLKEDMGDVGNFITVAGRNGYDDALILETSIAMETRLGDQLAVNPFTGPSSALTISLSDHRSYWDAGWPAVMVTDTAFLRNQAYHTEQDTADRLDYDRMALVVSGVAGAVEALAGLPVE